MSQPHADLLIRAHAVHTLVPGEPVQRALAVTGERISALSPEPNGLDHLVTEHTAVIDATDATVLPAFDDTHTHLIFAAYSSHDVPVHQARSIPEFLDLIRQRAAVTPPGEWIRTTTNWQELNLAERRMPTRAELDQVTAEHPVLVKRGGHNDMLNSPALRLAGITADTPEPPGGQIVRDQDGRPTGRLVGTALALVEKLLPRPDLATRIDGLRAASQDYAATGIGTVRDCLVPIEDLDVLRAAHQAGALHVRMRALVSGFGARSAAEVDELLDRMEPWRDAEDPWLQVWGVKFGIDGGIEAGALEEPYADRDCYQGLLLWEPDTLVATIERVVRHGWRVGVHAWGDRGLRILLDVYEQVLDRHPGLEPGTLVIEHGGLATPEQRARAIRLGIPVTVQHPLLHDAAAPQIQAWGPQRVRDIFPLREWIDEGALITAGSDFPVGPYGAMPSLWGMTTRQTAVGVQGAEHAISRAEAVALHTTNAARLLGEDGERGTLAVGALADLTVWPEDPFTRPIEGLAAMRPTVTLVGGRAVHDPAGLATP
ncbi:amidohydrolase [Kitasatospora azatica]|uniref:amidohydrolase n=1 Tax=Kitasatospora azatica TaxID=58347 RepID=UPI000563C3F1|nr:amidohydrolase [Kitasatospora azatica]